MVYLVWQKITRETSVTFPMIASSVNPAKIAVFIWPLTLMFHISRRI